MPAAVLRVVHAHELTGEVADAERGVLPVPDVPPGLAQWEADRAQLEPRRAVERAEHPHGHVGARAAHGRLHVRVELRAVDVAAAHGAAPLAAGNVDPVLPVVATAAREVRPLAVDLLARGGVSTSLVQCGSVLEEPGDGRRQVDLLGVEEQRGAVVPDHRVRLLQRRHRRQVELDVAQARHAVLAWREPVSGAAEGAHAHSFPPHPSAHRTHALHGEERRRPRQLQAEQRPVRLALVREVLADACHLLERWTLPFRRHEAPDRPVSLRRHGDPEVGVASAVAVAGIGTAATGMEFPDERVVQRLCKRRRLRRGAGRALPRSGNEDVAVQRAAVWLAVVAQEGEPRRDADRPVKGGAAAATPPRRQGADLLERGGRGELQLPSADAYPPLRESTACPECNAGSINQAVTHISRNGGVD